MSKQVPTNTTDWAASYEEEPSQASVPPQPNGATALKPLGWAPVNWAKANLFNTPLTPSIATNRPQARKGRHCSS